MPIPPVYGEIPNDPDPGDTAYTLDPLQFASLIPLFEFGEGTGGIGCVAIVAPVFMSEEEAFAVLSATFEEAGLTLHRSFRAIENVNVPVTNVDGERVDPDTTVSGYIRLSGLLEEPDLPVVFVSRWHVSNWHKDIDGGPRLSFNSFDVKGAAKTLAENNPGIAVFYDPVAGRINYDSLWVITREPGESDRSYENRINERLEELSMAALAESEQMLRLQAEAFVAWLGDGGF